ncbi:MAG: hypothetical protein DRR06_10570 [Gammaproteobacteria bacterium]|nr:MAG: hypothetical protein DRR06_10570 [Gammaproteobacteria bacterium]RLA53132.1 MAG: hypothetical protein DRR42_05740 [Gammaproteobacteria bacterium]
MLKWPTRITSAVIAIAALGLPISTLSAADPIADSVSKAINEGDIALNFRYRYEYVDQDGLPKDANASTLRTRLTVTSGEVGGFQVLVQGDNVSYLGNDNFNNTDNGKTSYPVVADPDYTEVNQAFISYAFYEKNKVIGGRQSINYADQRFIGSVGWRQNEQTMDSARFQLNPMSGLTLDYSYIWRVNRIFDPDSDKSKFKGDSHAAIVSYKIAEGHTLSAYGYLLDLDEAPTLSSKTFGATYQGSFKPSERIGLGLSLAAAQQQEYNDNPNDYSADYYFGELTAKFKLLSISLGYEELGSDDGISLQTPLATLHKFQGFADKFLTTPVDGMEDTYIKAVTTVGGIKLIVFYHEFEAENGSMDYGSEFDFVAAYKFNKNYSVLFKYAAYDADDFASDTDKAWLMLTAAF